MHCFPCLRLTNKNYKNKEKRPNLNWNKPLNVYILLHTSLTCCCLTAHSTVNENDIVQPTQKQMTWNWILKNTRVQASGVIWYILRINEGFVILFSVMEEIFRFLSTWARKILFPAAICKNRDRFKCLRTEKIKTPELSDDLRLFSHNPSCYFYTHVERDTHTRTQRVCTHELLVDTNMQALQTAWRQPARTVASLQHWCHITLISAASVSCSDGESGEREQWRGA